MNKRELIKRLKAIRSSLRSNSDLNKQVKSTISHLIDDIEEEGVRDVQARSDIADKMKLPRVR